MGKHIDKIPWDAPEGIKTLPVLLGEAPARRFTQGLMVGFYVTVALVVARRAPVAGAGRRRRAARPASRCGSPSASRGPTTPPPGFPVWPLWFAP